MKVTYAEWKDFWAAIDAVPGHKNNWYEDDVPSWPETAVDSDVLNITSGFFQWQGDGKEISHPLIKNEGDWVASFRAWKRSLNYEKRLITVPKTDLERFDALMRENGWK